MSNAIEFPALALAPLAPQAPPAAEAPAVPTEAADAPADAGATVIGRRWSDGAGTYAPADPNAPWSMNQQWPNLVAALSEQAVEGSNLLLRALNYLVSAGRLRPSEARALTDAMQQLRGTSLRAQQITRLAGGRIRQARERVDLAELVRHVLDDRGAGVAAAGAVVRSELQGVDVLLDPPVAISLLNAVLDWGLSFSKDIALELQPAHWPGPARLQVRVATPAAGGAPAPAWSVRPRGRRLNDGLHWMLLRQIAASAGLEVVRSRADGAALLTIEFPKTFLNTQGLACLELNDEDDPAADERDTWALVLAADERVRREAVDALRKMGIEALSAADTAQARKAVATRRPNVLVSCYDIPGAELQAFRQEVLGGGCPLVEITRELPSFHLSGFDRFETPKVGREQLGSELAPTVLFELVKAV